MMDQFDISIWLDALTHAAETWGTGAASALTTMMLGLLLVGLGLALAAVTARVARLVVRLVGADRATARWSKAAALEQVGIHLVPSDVVPRLLFWLTLLSFGLLVAETLGLTAVTAVIGVVASYLPNVAGAVIIGLVGVLLARLVGTLVRSAAASGGAARARRIGSLAHGLVIGLVLVLAVEQLGMARELFILPFTAVLATAGFGVGLAFALGARPIITHILAGHFLRESLPRDAFVEINGERGVVERVGSTDTLLKNDQKTWSVPNGRLLEEVVVR